MIKMLLVDDEDLSRFAFRALLSRHFDDIQIVAEAENGQEAIEAVEEYHPEIVVMDIHMPGIDGLQTMKRIVEINPNISVLICSAYDNFDYVSQAMDLGAKGYLLKPVTKEDLADKLANIRNTTNENIQAQTLHSFSDQTLIEMLLAGRPGESLKNDLMKMYKTNLEYGIFVLVDSGEENTDDIKAALNQVINEVITRNQFSLQAIIGNKLVFFISGCDKKNQSALDEDGCYNLISLADQITENLEQELEHPVRTNSIIVKNGNWLEAWHNLTNEQTSSSSVEQEAHELISEIAESVKNNEQEIARFKLARWLEIVMPIQTDMRLILISHLIFKLNHLLEEMLLSADYRNFDRIISGVIDKNQPEMLELIVRQQLAGTFESLRFKSERKHDLIEKINDVIDKEDLKNVTLGSIAEEIGISAQYLCKSFKEETDSTFHKYLTSKRIRLAKQLMTDNSLTIKEIAARCGYQDTIYFTKLFKKMSGITPSEYRNRLS